MQENQETIGRCDFRLGVECTDKKICNSCGWNPIEENRRIQIIKNSDILLNKEKPFSLLIKRKNIE